VAAEGELVESAAGRPPPAPEEGEVRGGAWGGAKLQRTAAQESSARLRSGRVARQDHAWGGAKLRRFRSEESGARLRSGRVAGRVSPLSSRAGWVKRAV
jgi:hypothetical protein